jgi:hypothetical protein
MRIDFDVGAPLNSPSHPHKHARTHHALPDEHILNIQQCSKHFTHPRSYRYCKYLEQYSNAEVHKWLSEIYDTFSRIVDGHGCHSQVSFLEKKQRNGNYSEVLVLISLFWVCFLVTLIGYSSISLFRIVLSLNIGFANRKGIANRVSFRSIGRSQAGGTRPL